MAYQGSSPSEVALKLGLLVVKRYSI